MKLWSFSNITIRWIHIIQPSVRFINKMKSDILQIDYESTPDDSFFLSLFGNDDQKKKPAEISQRNKEEVKLQRGQQFYKKMKLMYTELTNEFVFMLLFMCRFIPTLERNKILLQSKNTLKYVFISFINVDRKLPSKRLLA